MIGPKPGDRVRGTFEGVVNERQRAVGDGWVIPLNLLRDVEILPPPKPGWQPGDIVLDADGVAWRCTAGGARGEWLCVYPEFGTLRDLHMRRPLRRARIVPDEGAS